MGRGMRTYALFQPHITIIFVILIVVVVDEKIT